MQNYKLAKQQQRFFKIIGITPELAYEKYQIPPIDMYIEKSCINIVDRILKDPTHPLTQAQSQQPEPKYYTRNSHIRITKAKTTAYENSCLQIALKIKRDGYRDKYTKPRKKEATSVVYNLEIRKRKKKENPTKRLQTVKSNQSDTNLVTCDICKLQFKKRGIKQHITKMRIQ